MNLTRWAWGASAVSAMLAWGGTERVACAVCVMLAYGFACVAIVARHRRRQRSGGGVLTHDDDILLLAYASQTGTAEALAMQSAAFLAANGVQARVASLGVLTIDDIASHARALFIVSTTGEGDAPDNALRFVRGAMAHDASLATLRFAVLSLGDRRYVDFCAFGRKLCDWLGHCRAEPLFDAIEIDSGDPLAIQHWRRQLAALCNGPVDTHWSLARDSVWTLQSRSLLNPGSAGAGAFHVVLKPQGAAPLDWQAGDIAEILPCHAEATVQEWVDARGLNGATMVECEGIRLPFTRALAVRDIHAADTGTRAPQAWIDALAPLARRSYSIASLPGDGGIELLVRQALRSDETPGVASGWLTRHAQEGGDITLRVRTNRLFHAPADNGPLILIGNGTGLAGLRAHIKTRAQAQQARIWLLFGERNAARDAFWRDEINQWCERGVIQRVDYAWSRDGGPFRYVQDALRAAKNELLDWINEGAVIYVCGSRKGMAAGVHHALIDLLGEGCLESLALEGRYRRDVY